MGRLIATIKVSYANDCFYTSSLAHSAADDLDRAKLADSTSNHNSSKYLSDIVIGCFRVVTFTSFHCTLKVSGKCSFCMHVGFFLKFIMYLLFLFVLYKCSKDVCIFGSNRI